MDEGSDEVSCRVGRSGTGGRARRVNFAENGIPPTRPVQPNRLQNRVAGPMRRVPPGVLPRSPGEESRDRCRVGKSR